MKKTKSRLFLLLACVFSFSSLLFLTGCTQETSQAEAFTVSFETNGGSVIGSISVENGRKLPADIAIPTKDDNSQFVGWYKDNETFQTKWNFELDIVTAHVTLYAKWIKFEPYPTEVAFTDEAFSDTLSWIQTGITSETVFQVTIFEGTKAIRQETQKDSDGADVIVDIEYYIYTETGTIVSGTHSITGDTTVTWTPSTPVAGGVYKIEILTDGLNQTVIEPLYFKGEGSEINPYLLYEAADLMAISTIDDVGLDHFYKVADNFSAEVSYAEIENKAFLGTLNGNNLIITLTGNAGMFYELGTSALIYDLTVSGTITTASIGTLGGYAVINRGIIRDCHSRVAITSSAGTVGDPDTKYLGGAGGFVGINEEGGRIESSVFIGSSSSEGVIKALIGGAGIASINKGIIEDCTNMGTLGAYNSVESGKSLSNYSYMGGIAGFNYGTITRSRTTSSGKLLAQRYYNNGSPADTANNRVIGGIAGYNAEGAIISESFFNGIRVHGDQYVGGIAGINAGLITDSYTGGRYFSSTTARSYIAGRLNVGGIAGLLEGTGSVVNCYNAANVYAFDDQPYAIASTATNSVYLTRNHDPRTTGTQLYGNSSTDTPLAPSGTGNVAVPNTALTLGDGIHYALPSAYQATLGNKFIIQANETILAWQAE